MEVEHDVIVLPLNDKLQAEIDKRAKDGWMLVPGVQPVAIYHVVRPKPATVPMGRGTMTIDDSKIGILRDGKLVS